MDFHFYTQQIDFDQLVYGEGIQKYYYQLTQSMRGMIEQCDFVAVQSVVFPQSQPQVNSANNKFKLKVDGDTLNCVFEEGNYSFSTVGAEVAAQLNAYLQPYGVALTCVVDQPRRNLAKLRFTSDTLEVRVLVDDPDSEVHKLLGIEHGVEFAITTAGVASTTTCNMQLHGPIRCYSTVVASHMNFLLDTFRAQTVAQFAYFHGSADVVQNRKPVNKALWPQSQIMLWFTQNGTALRVQHDFLIELVFIKQVNYFDLFAKQLQLLLAEQTKMRTQKELQKEVAELEEQVNALSADARQQLI